jgi:thiamine biosynthesis lipoprotein ApbE
MCKVYWIVLIRLLKFAGDAYSCLKRGSDEYVKFVAPGLLPEDLIDIDEYNNSIHFLHPSVSLDFGGFGKGLALDKASIILDDFGVQNAFISFGGSSILNSLNTKSQSNLYFSNRFKNINIHAR